MKQYRVNPADISTIPKYEVRDGFSHEFAMFLIVLSMGSFILTAGWAIYNLIAGGYGWLFCLAIFGLIVTLFMSLSKKEETEVKTEMAISQAEEYSSKLNMILSKSEEIPSIILPYLEATAKKHIDFAKTDFSDNAISPFWDNIEEASKFLALYKEAIDQLQLNGELYSKILDGKSHNFPDLFPIGTNISISNELLDEYNAIIRKAHTRPEFGNIWEQRKTQKILIAGFQNLGQAINNMKDEIISSIGSLEYSIQSGFRDLKNIQLEQLRTFETSQAVLNNTLTSMDKKLYYIQYKEKPIRPFIRPLGDI
jgi:hypothetical protein